MLDVADPNQISLALGMGTRNEQLAEYFLRAAGVAAVWIDPDGHIGGEEVASLALPPGRVAFCCVRGSQFVLTYRLELWKRDNGSSDQCFLKEALARALEQIARDGGVGLTPHAIAIQRAMAGVGAVNKSVEEMKSTGKLQAFNQAFKAARKVDPSLRYHDYLHAHKAGMLEQLAREGQR